MRRDNANITLSRWLPLESSKLLISLRNDINELSHKVKTPPAAGLNMGSLKWPGVQ
jgi:hypothetical protein